LWLGLDECYATWELEKDIPPHIIKEFKESTAVVADEISARNMAQTATTLTVANLTTEPQAKKSKTERITVVKDDG